MLFLKNILEKRGVFNVCGREKNELAPFESSLPLALAGPVRKYRNWTNKISQKT